MAINMVSGNKTIKEYWDGMWQNSGEGDIPDPYDLKLRNYAICSFHTYFERVFATLGKEKSSLLEIGCGNSVWLPYFHKEFGLDVSGLDYSEVGCAKARQNLEKNGVTGEVVCEDLFSPPSHMLGCYDLVVSFGVVEHFEDTSECLQALSRYLKTGGLLITNIPNMAGFQGFVQKYINRPVFDIHNPLGNKQFHYAHEAAGLEVIECEYFMSTNFGVCNLNGISPGSIGLRAKKLLLALLARMSMLIWVIERRFGALSATHYFSPYVNCIARKQ